MPQNCSLDLNTVIDHIDTILTTGTALDKQQLKALFGLEGLEHDDDFAAWVTLLFLSYYFYFSVCHIQVANTISSFSSFPFSAIENGPWLWQANSFYTGYSGFFEFCDYVEVSISDLYGGP